MDKEQSAILKEISQKDFDRDYFIELINNNTNIRNLVISEMLANPDIMIYYHCFYIVTDASRMKPELYYEYWDEFVKLLEHSNSYHRDFGLELIANLVQVDNENRLSLIWTRYTEHLYDKKFMTGECCLSNLRVILKVRTDLIDEVIIMLLNFSNKCHYSEKQIALLESNMLDIFDDSIDKSSYKEEMISFIENRRSSISPKTRKRANQLLNRYKNGSIK